MSLSFSSIAFTGNNLQRLSQARRDNCVEEVRRTGNYHLVIFSEGCPVMRKERLFLTPDEGQDFPLFWSGAVLLGYGLEPLSPKCEAVFGVKNYSKNKEVDSVGYPKTVTDTLKGAVLAVEVESACEISTPFERVDMRSLYSNGKIKKTDLGILAQAACLLTWHKKNQFCACCGAKTYMRDGGVRRFCDGCGAEHFPRTDPVAIMLVYSQQRCLLARNINFPERRFSCLAGFIDQGETFEAAVRREVWEGTGIKTGNVRYIASQPWPFPHSLMLGAFAEALDDNILIDRHEIVQADWFSRDDIAAMMTDSHPQDFTLPPSGSIAHFLIRSFVEGEGTNAFASHLHKHAQS